MNPGEMPTERDNEIIEWTPDICVYHGGCDDGFGAAWIVKNRLDVSEVAKCFGGGGHRNAAGFQERALTTGEGE